MASQDLSRASQRRDAQNRITNNRDAIIPTRRTTDLPAAQVRADMRNAFRPNEADEIRRALGMVDDATRAWNDIEVSRLTERAEQDFAAGSMAATSGAAMDPAKAKQEAYQRGYYKVTAQADQTAFEIALDNRTRDLVSKGATPDQIHAEVMAMTKAHAEAVSTKYPLAEIKSGVAARTSAFVADLDTKLNGLIRERTTDEMVLTATTNLQTRLRSGERIEFESEVKTLKDAGIDPKRAKSELKDAVIAVALDPANPRPELIADLIGTTVTPKATASRAASAPGAGVATTFETAVPRMFDREGGYTASDGASRAPAKYGINQKANPDINVATLTKEEATRLYKERYWDAIEADKLPPAIRELAFDTAVNHGVGRAKTLIAKANGDPAKLIALRRAEYARLARNPEYAPAARGWEARLKAFEADIAVGAPVEGEVEPVVVTAARTPQISLGSFTPAEQAQILNALAQAENLAERREKEAKEEAKDELLGRVYEASQNGVFLDSEIDAAVAAGDIDASDGMALRSANRQLVTQTQAGEANTALVTKYDLRLAEVEPKYDAIRADATRDYNAGLFGTGQAAAQAYVDVMQATASGTRAERQQTAQQKAVTKSARGYVTSVLRPAKAPGMPVDANDARLFAQATQDFESRVRAGTDPMTAADEVIAAWGPRINGTKAPAQASGGRGVGRNAAPDDQKTFTYDPTTKSLQ